MNLSNLIDKLNNELDKLNSLKNQGIDTSSFFTNNVHFNDDVPIDALKNSDENNIQEDNTSENNLASNNETLNNRYADIIPDHETKSLVEVKPNYLVAAQTMFRKTIRFSLKSFLISISLSFLNLFV